MSRLKKLRHAAAYRLAQSCIILFARLPRNLAVALGGWIGLAAWWLLVKDQYLMERHLALAFKQRLGGQQRRNIGRGFYINSGKSYSDLLRLRRTSVNNLEGLISVEGLPHLEKAYLRGDGVVAIGAHLGNYELLGAILVSLGFRVGVVGRALYDQRLDRLLVNNRAEAGLVNFRSTDSPRRLIEWLRSGAVLGVLIDTDSHRVRGVPVPFFGRLANTPVGEMILGLRAKSAFCPMVCVRTEENGYKVIIRPAVEIPRSGHPGKDAHTLTALCTKELESLIRSYPDQWIWLHNRWHTKFDKAS